MIKNFSFTRRAFSEFGSLFGAAVLFLAGCAFLAPSAEAQANLANPTLTLMSTDPFTVGPGQHATEVEPHAVSNGSTMVGAFQTGRISPGGSTDIGWATSTDGGVTWTHGFLPGLTTGEGSGPYAAASDPAVAYDAKHGIWMIASLPIASFQTPAVVVSRSADGINWGNPVSVGPNEISSDKNWIVCDSSSTSKFYGNCYVEWDNPFTGDGILMSTSTDGGITWGNPVAPAGNPAGIGGQPLVRPNGTVIVPILTNGMSAFRSIDGGTTWTRLVNFSNVKSHFDAGGIRSGPLPSAAIDGAGKVYVVWEDCRFRASCSTNDLVYSTSTDGITWTAVTRVPIALTTGKQDYFIPGIGIDPVTSGASAHIAIHYYFYTNTKCSVSTCKLNVGFISSANGGATWNTPVTLAGPMQLDWLPNSQNGLMVGDYIATAFNNGVPHGIFEVAAAKSGSTFNEATYTAQGLTAAQAGPQLSSAGDRPLPNVHGDPIEKERPEKGLPPARRSARK
jgi:hypothetical protein